MFGRWLYPAAALLVQIAELDRPTLVLAPNKTLAAQLYNEFKALFPENAVEYFVSYYDYYQPEAYIPASDTYISKDSSINEMIDKLRHSATRSVLSRRDVIVVASVSCIYGLGAPEDYLGLRIELEKEMEIGRDGLLRELVSLQYERNDHDFHRGVFRVRGDRVELFPAYEEDRALRIDFFGDRIEEIAEIDALRGLVIKRLERATVFPASHYVTSKVTRKRAIETIIAELKQRIAFFRAESRFVETQRIEERTNFDLEMIQELGYCNGIENYSRHLTGRAAGDPPPTLLDYFPEDYLMFIDESHIAVPQLRAMYRGDRSRKQTLVEYGFRLPSALDNRPLRFDECQGRFNQVIFVSATPADYERSEAQDTLVEQILAAHPSVHAGGESVAVSLPLAGTHNVSNACAAAAVATALGLSLEDIARGLESVRPVSGRLQALAGQHGSALYDDSYNANPLSVRAAAEFLATLPGESWFVLGDMKELGEDEERLHAEVGEALRATGIDRLFATGDLCRAAVDAFGEGASWYGSVDALANDVLAQLSDSTNVLVKGSRSMRRSQGP